MARFATAILVGLLLTGCVTRAHPSTMQAPRVVRFGLTADYPPFAYRSSNGSFAGADVVIAQRVAAMLGARAEFELTTWQTLAADFAAGRFDIAIGGLSVTSARASLGVFSQTLLVDGKRPLARCDERSRYATREQINQVGVRVLTTAGPEITALSRQWFPHSSINVMSDPDAFTTALMQRTADVWVTDGVVVDQMARRYPRRLCATTLTPYTSVEKAWLIHADDHLVAAVNSALSRLLRSGAWSAALQAVR